MHDMFRFAKRHTPDLFVPRYGMASHLYEHNSKFLFDRYGVPKHYYPATTELAIIEADIKQLLSQVYKEETFRDLVEPKDMYD